MLTEDGQSLVGFGIGSDGPNAIQMLHGPAGMNKPLAEWNEVEVGCRGGELKMAVNGADCGGGASRPGFIGIQCSCGRVEFRGLRIKPLPGGEGWRTLDGNSLPAKFELRFRFKPLADSRGGVVFVSGQKTVFEIRIDNRDMEEFTGSLAGKVGALELRALDDSWNHMRIAVDGPNIRVWVNGMTVVDFVSTGRMSCAGAATRFNVDRGSIEFEDIEIKTKE
jgi:hypothetical protein